jgi:hypothetical protein
MTRRRLTRCRRAAQGRIDHQKFAGNVRIAGNLAIENPIRFQGTILADNVRFVLMRNYDLDTYTGFRERVGGIQKGVGMLFYHRSCCPRSALIAVLIWWSR